MRSQAAGQVRGRSSAAIPGPQAQPLPPLRTRGPGSAVHASRAPCGLGSTPRCLPTRWPGRAEPLHAGAPPPGAEDGRRDGRTRSSRHTHSPCWRRSARRERARPAVRMCRQKPRPRRPACPPIGRRGNVRAFTHAHWVMTWRFRLSMDCFSSDTCSELGVVISPFYFVWVWDFGDKAF
jgi:hypothetical protein